MKFLLLIGFVFVVSLTHAEDTDVEQPEARSTETYSLVKPIKATASSIYGKSKLLSLLDGKIGSKTTWNWGECFHTGLNDKPWVKFDLGKKMAVGKVVIFNRVDCCADRLFPLQVTVGDNYNNMEGGKACTIPSGKPNPVSIDCKQNVGRYVMVRVLKKTYLNICEVKIYAKSGLIPVAFEGGNAGATSYWSEDYKPAAAFSMSAPIGWHTAKGKAGEVKPQVIFYQFKTALKVAKVAFQPRKDCRGFPLEKTPKKFQIVASNDAKCNVKSKWVVLVQKERGKLKDCNDVDITIIPDAKQNMYTCYGINILSTISDSTQTHKHAALSRIKMWRQDTITGAVSCSKSAQLDLQIIVDSSGSVGIKHFQQMMKDIADKVLSSFVIGPKHTRVALFKYSNLMVNEFDLDKFSDIKSLKTATAAVKYTGGGTKTGTAMKEALGHFTKKMRKDAKTAKVCIVFTDGESMDAKIIPGVTKEWAKAGVTVFAVGIGKGISKKGLVAVAGDAQHALQVNDFSELATSAKTLLVEVCKTIVKKIVKKIPKPTCFSYPAAKNVAYTSLKPLRSMDLGALTVDIYATLTQSTGDPCYVSYAIPSQNNELVLGSKGYVHINGALPIRRHTSIPALKRKVRYTVTWDGTSGVTVLYIDGKESARGTHKGKLRAGGSFVLGQEQDSVGGGFVSSQRFIGDLCDLQMWARVLSTAEREALFSGRAVSRGDVFDLPPTYTHALHAGALMV